MKSLKLLGLIIFIFCFGLFIASITLSKHKIEESSLISMKQYHAEMFKKVANNLFEKEYSSNFSFIADLKPYLIKTKEALDENCGINPEKNIWSAVNLPEGVNEWDYRMSDYDIKKYTISLTKDSSVGLLPQNSGLFFLLIFMMSLVRVSM